MAGPVKGTGRIARLALLTAIALTIFMAEAQLPVIPVPGVKLGLANIVTVYAMFSLGPGDALLVLSGRVFLGAVPRKRWYTVPLQTAEDSRMEVRKRRPVPRTAWPWSWYRRH